MEAARPGRCPGCGAASRETGRGLTLHGHGLRPRTVFTLVGGRTKIVEILARRYVCLACDAVVLVLPADVARRHLYTRIVIAAALAQWSHGGLSARAVRACFGAFVIQGHAATGWPSLGRWTLSTRFLWPRLRAADGPPQQVAHRVSAQLAAFAPLPTGHVLNDAVAGAIHAA